MRGRRPLPLTILAADVPILEAVARSRRLAWFQVQHARIVLAVAAGERVRDIASRLECDRRLTPAHASWLNQAELLVKAFGGRYLKRGSWASRAEFIEHVLASWPEYNQRYAQPFKWTWTNDRMRKWFAEHGGSICCRTS